MSKILEQERSSVELWAKAIEFNSLPVNEQASTKLFKATRLLRRNPAVPDSVIQLIMEAEAAKSSNDFVSQEIIIDEKSKIPAIVVDDENVIIISNNVDSARLATPRDQELLIREYKSLNPEIKITIGDEKKKIVQYVYYGESPTVQLLRYFPYVQILILALLLGIGFTTYRSITRSEQSNLWVGMAKEAAHQLGTPISSLYGWIHLMKDEYRHDETATNITSEIEKDVQRLAGVAERFGKIGSEPELKLMNIEPILDQVLAYMERRLPRLGKGIRIEKELKAEGKVLINPELFQWAIENLVKNAMDALQSSKTDSYIKVTSNVDAGEILIDIEDSGLGIDIKHVRSVFRPGFSTKKRGWGLGLSLTKRIIEDYHNGSVYVLRSELNEGTTMRVTLKIEEENEQLTPMIDQSPV
ncbi:sensor histidine kinase [Balneola vulgaris]|uniref:sensor histidine kinase n=1 Tax=Balneola vulgaris TaxID=287535 RepID=UPI00035C9B1D|nr:HAMP domain-containing sensor histidine kinase [Balneola vulgaris]